MNVLCNVGNVDRAWCVWYHVYDWMDWMENKE